jgi:hypothetical protein
MSCSPFAIKRRLTEEYQSNCIVCVKRFLKVDEIRHIQESVKELKRQEIHVREIANDLREKAKLC